MDNSIIETIEKLYDKAEAFIKISIRLGKLEIIKSISDLLSDFVVKLVVFFVLGLSLLFFNIGVSIWLGEILGHQYLGFLTVALFYLLLALLTFVCRKAFIKDPINKAIIVALTKIN